MAAAGGIVAFVRVRTLRYADVETSLDLFESVAAEGLWLATEAPIDRREVALGWRDLLATGEGTLLVAEEGGAPVGLAALVGKRAPELGMLVRSDRGRRGIGDALVEACIAWARGRGAREIVLHVFAHDHAAIALYRKHGFEERAGAPRSYRRRNGERWDAIRMARTLGSDEASRPTPAPGGPRGRVGHAPRVGGARAPPGTGAGS